MKKVLFVLLSSLVVFTACEDHDKKEEKQLQAVTGEVKDINLTSATLFGFITVPSGVEVNSFGFRVSEQENITRENSTEITVEEKDYYNRFNAKVDQLLPEKTYYYAAFVETDSEYLIGPVNSFVTGKKYVMSPVDLGLTVLWASCNVGADKPEAAGMFFAWGEVFTKGLYDWSTYTSHSEGNSTSLIHYNTQHECGFIDNVTTLGKNDDAAAVLVSGKWRMPTEAEVNELLSKCDWDPVSVGGIAGYNVTGNDNTIFLPFTGYMLGSERYEKEKGHYWTSSLDADLPINAKELCFTEGFDHGSTEAVSFGRWRGAVVRPVMDK